VVSDDLTIVVPVLNEADALRRELGDWLRWCDERGSRLIVVDDGSTDGTPEVLSGYLDNEHFRVFRHPRNRGYGGAIKTGILHAETAFVGTMDADGQHSIADLGTLVALSLAHEADLVIGSRPRRGGTGIYRNMGKALIRLVAKMLFGVTVQDLNSGMKVYRTRLAQRLVPYCPDTMAFSDVIALTHLNLGYRVLEAPIELHERRSGKSTINTLTAVDTILEIVNVLMWYRPLKFFVPLSALLAVGGVVWAVPFLLMGRGLSSVSLLLMVGAMMIAVLGLLAEQLASMRRIDMPEPIADEVQPPATTSSRG
jgi:glycosyltransferase involved in cell wall biosynthesis